MENLNQKIPVIRPCGHTDIAAMHAIINKAAQAYKGVIPDDCWHEPYMPQDELQSEIENGVEFQGWEEEGALIGIMGLQKVKDVYLIRHAYVHPEAQGKGFGSKLLNHLIGQTKDTLLVGTWAAADWAIRLYERHGFRLVSQAEKDRLLSTYWRITDRQRETSIVLTYLR